MAVVDDLMSSLRAEGVVDSQGRFTLDREQARSKMQRFQLADARLYVLELVQAAVLRGATAIRFDIDADDMRMRFDGEPFTAAELEDLYGSVFADGHDRHFEGVRQLAIALNAAMNMNLSYIELRTGSLRLTVRLGTADTITTIDPPHDNTTIHVRRRFALSMVVDFFRNVAGRLDEEQYLRQRCCYASIPIDLEGTMVSRGLSGVPGSLIEVPFSDKGVRGVMALVEEDRSTELRLVKDGVWIDSREAPSCGTHIIAVVEDDGLRKDVSQARIVADGAFDAVVEALRRARWALWIEASRASATGQLDGHYIVGWIRDQLLDHATRSELEHNRNARELTKLVSWPDCRDAFLAELPASLTVLNEDVRSPAVAAAGARVTLKQLLETTADDPPGYPAPSGVQASPSGDTAGSSQPARSSVEAALRSAAMRLGAPAARFRRAQRARGSMLLGVFALGGACQPVTTEIDLRVVLPDGASDLEATNNVTLVLTPNGFSHTVATLGVNFDLEAELEPDDEVRQLSVFLARNANLLAWGRTPGFTFHAASRGAAVFVARPQRLSTFPLALAIDDPHLRAAHARGHGLIALESNGTTTFVDGLTLDVQRGQRLVPERAIDDDDGAFVGDALGGVQRLAWRDGVRGYRFDPADNTWIELPLRGAGGVGARAEAAYRVDEVGERLWIYGGGEHRDVVAVSLLPTGERAAVESVEGLQLDGPRRGATAMPVVRQDHGVDTTVLFGSDDPDRAVAFLVERGQALGPPAIWLGARCVQLDHGGPNVSLRVLCAGGVRDTGEDDLMPTADGLLVSLPGLASTDAPSAQLLSDVLGVPMADPWWLVDEEAVFAQGDGHLVRVEREDLQVSEIDAPAPRWRGGSFVRLPTGATFLAGGVDAEGAALAAWQVFMPMP